MKRIPVRTRGFGAEVGTPAVADLARWVERRKGQGGDLLAYRIERSAALQDGVDFPAVGGIFYGERVLECLAGVGDGAVTGEVGTVPDAALDDLRGWKKNAWLSLPAPSMLGLEDRYFGDPEEAEEEVCRAFRRLLREMRDAGVGGHVILIDDADETELDLLAGTRSLFFPLTRQPAALEAVLEHQSLLPLAPSELGQAADLIDRYDIRELSLLHPDHQALGEALDVFDPDEISAGGYTDSGDEEAWTALLEEAYVLK
ncbi:hypothetical protein E2N92_04575 [Methanofollis formosanus]|uniref:Uncharacterized protein n=1 Tax=Methanofollis formosanus TaxID=299308 RepID=A0A8G1A1K7_9EURY|nr:hypothetical protein [Methanofollis formosanus]QYZ78753.1 hypothetical protein E2N92_04575 [Methanofollis formosanus]